VPRLVLATGIGTGSADIFSSGVEDVGGDGISTSTLAANH